MPVHRRLSTLSDCPQVWALPASLKPPSTAPWTSWPRPSTPAPTTPRLWLPATLTPCVWTPSPRGSPSPTLYPHLLHQHLQMTQTLASRTDCGISQLPLQPQSMVSHSHKAGDHFMCNTIKYVSFKNTDIQKNISLKCGGNKH